MSWASAARDVAYGVGLGVSAPVWGWSLWRTGKWRTDWGGRFGDAGRVAEASSPGERPRVLVHGVSVGEINLVRGLVGGLVERGCAVVVASTTNTGFARAESVFGGEGRVAEATGPGGGGVMGVVRWPLDFSFAVRRFLDAVEPDAVVSAELEVWPNFLEACERRGVPFVVVNGRLSARSFRRYRKVKALVGSTFGRVSAAGVQTEPYAARFVEMGVPADRVAVLDTMKWDTAKIEPADQVEAASALAADLGIDRARPVVVAGSTALGEAALLGEALRGWGEGVQLVVAPRKPEWFEASAKELAGCGWDVVRRTERVSAASGRCVFLLDTIGELRAAYALADVCVVGRSFTGALYGSDPMEPAGLGKATVIGPWHGDFAETVAAMRDAGGLVVTEDERGADVGGVVKGLLDDPARAAAVAAAGIGVIRSRQGATERHVDMVMRELVKRPAVGDRGLR